MKKTAVALGLILALLILLALSVPLFPGGRGIPKVTHELNSLIVAIRQYRNEFQELPPIESLGRALLGDNPKKMPFFEQRLGESRPIKDLWGTPYQFAYTSSGTVLIRSAGKDKIFSTEDDYAKETEELNRPSSQHRSAP